MPAVSKEQQRLMGVAYKVKSGDENIEDVDPLYRDKVKGIVDGMSLEQIKDYAETSHKNLPETKDKSIKEYSLGSYYTGSYFWFTQAGQAGVQKVAMTADKNDPLIQSFMDYMKNDDGMRKVDDENETEVKEGDLGTALSASPSNVPGMGNVTPPSVDQEGSGDVLGYTSKDDEDVNLQKGIMSYEEYKKWIKSWQEKNQKHPAVDQRQEG